MFEIYSFMIKILFQTESHYPTSRKKIQEAVLAHLASKIRSDAEVSISIVGDRKMKKLNKDYRNKDSTTDVLSFPQNDPSQPSKHMFVAPPDNVLRLGDIVVSYPQAVVEAGQEQKLVDDKIIELVLHGMDHLMGIHHE